MRPRRIWLPLGALILFAAGCATDTEGEQSGLGAEEFFAEWSDAWAASDSYDIVRFYDTDVAVGLAQDYRSLSLSAGYSGTAVSGAGRAWLVEWIEAQFEPRERSLVGVFVGNDAAITVSVIDEINGAMAVTMEIGDGVITGYTDLKWRDAHLEGGAPDSRVAWLDHLVDAHIAGSAGSDLGDLDVSVVRSGDRDGRAIFLGPDVAVYLVEAVTANCTAEYAVLMSLDDERQVVAEEWLPSLSSVRRCEELDFPSQGWWADIEVPPPVGEQATGVVVNRDGTEVTIYNGSEELERLLVWGLERFEGAELDPPRLSSAAFAPLPVCRNVPGVITDSGDGRTDLVLCTDSYRACEPDRDSCEGFTTGSRLGMLHELAHVWVRFNLSDGAKTEFLSIRGLEGWSDGSIPWHERGAEQAAEILAWGLLDEDIRLVRVGDPTCQEAASAFAVLTGSPPMRSCDR